MGDLQFTSYNPQGWSFTVNVDEQACSGNYPCQIIKVTDTV